jgi:hypothetical protein
MVMAVEELESYSWPEWPEGGIDWVTVVSPEGRYQVRPVELVIRNTTTRAVARVTVDPVDPWFRPTREWAAKAVRAARAHLSGF